MSACNGFHPGLLIDPESVRALLAEAMGRHDERLGEVENLRVERCWPGKKGMFSAQWSFGLPDGGRHHVHAWYDPRLTGLSAGEDDLSFDGRVLSGVCLTVARLGLMIHTADRDPVLPMREAAEGWEKLVPLCPRDVWDGRSGRNPDMRPAVLSYRPRRRVTLRYSGQVETGVGPGVIGKMFRDDRAAMLLERHERAGRLLQEAHGSRLGVARAVGVYTPWRMLLFKAASSMMWPVEGTTADGRALLISALHALHGIGFDGLVRFTADQEMSIVHRWVEAAEAFNAGVGDDLTTLARRLDESGELLKNEISGDACVIHRDYYPSQLLSDGEGMVLLDLDTLAWGSPCVDLGNLAAHLLLDESIAGRTVDVEAMLVDLSARYEAQGGRVERRALRFYTATSLIRVGAVHSLRSVTSRFARDLWREAYRLVGAEVPGRLRMAMPDSFGPSEAEVITP